MNFHIITIFLYLMNSRPNQRRTNLVPKFLLYLFWKVIICIALAKPQSTGLTYTVTNFYALMSIPSYTLKYGYLRTSRLSKNFSSIMMRVLRRDESPVKSVIWLLQVWNILYGKLYIVEEIMKLKFSIEIISRFCKND